MKTSPELVIHTSPSFTLVFGASMNPSWAPPTVLSIRPNWVTFKRRVRRDGLVSTPTIQKPIPTGGLMRARLVQSPSRKLVVVTAPITAADEPLTSTPTIPSPSELLEFFRTNTSGVLYDAMLTGVHPAPKREVGKLTTLVVELRLLEAPVNGLKLEITTSPLLALPNIVKRAGLTRVLRSKFTSSDLSGAA